MTASKLRILSVRLPEADLRRFKSTAAARGVSLQEAVRIALQTWTAGEIAPPTLDELQGSLRGVDLLGVLRAAKRSEDAKSRRRTARKPAA
jgi:hypothetical protein